MTVPTEVTREELEAALPWVRYLPDAAMGEFLCAIDIYREAAEIYSGQREPSGLLDWLWLTEDPLAVITGKRPLDAAPAKPHHPD